MPPQQPASASASRGYLWLALVLVLGLVVWSLSGRSWRHVSDPNAVPRAITPRGDLAADEQATIALFRNTSPSVAYITTLALRRDVFSLNLFEIPQGTGSGFVWDQEDTF